MTIPNAIDPSRRNQSAWNPEERHWFGLPAKFWFWAVLLIGFCLMQVVHNEIKNDAYAGLASVVVILVGSFLINLFAGLRVIETIWNNWKKAVVYVLIFLLLGVVYVGARWSVTMWQWSSAYEVALVKFKKERGIIDPGVPAAALDEWQRLYSLDRKIGPWPDPLSEKVQVQARRWFVAWPWSLLQWSLGDLFNTIIDWMMNFISKMMVSITDYFTSHLPGIKK